MRKINKIIIHCSDSEFGNVALIDAWHKAKGWDGCGYHYILLNSYPDAESLRLHKPLVWMDGVVEKGRPVEDIGAHTYGENTDSIAICFIGKNLFTFPQFASLRTLVSEVRADYPDVKVYGHYELQASGRKPKTCPNLDMDWIRKIMSFSDGSDKPPARSPRSTSKVT